MKKTQFVVSRVRIRSPSRKPPHVTSVQYCGWRLFSRLEVVEYIGGIASVLWGIASVLWKLFSTVGDNISTCGGYHQYYGGKLSTVENSFSTVGA